MSEENYTNEQVSYIALTEEIEQHLESVMVYLHDSSPSDRRKAAEHLRDANKLFKFIDLEEDLPDEYVNEIEEDKPF